jgi:Ca2+-binding EF-hand superfamily protein
MHSLVNLAVFSGLLLGLATASPLRGEKERTPQRTIAKLDKNGDGKLSLEEYSGRNDKRKESRTRHFRKLDRDGDGFVTPDEYRGKTEKKTRKAPK